MHIPVGILAQIATCLSLTDISTLLLTWRLSRTDTHLVWKSYYNHHYAMTSPSTLRYDIAQLSAVTPALTTRRTLSTALPLASVASSTGISTGGVSWVSWCDAVRCRTMVTRNWEKGTPRVVLRKRHTGWISSMIWLNEWYLATGGMDHNVMIWTRHVTPLCQIHLTAAVTCMHSLEPSLQSPSATITPIIRFIIGMIDGECVIAHYDHNEERIILMTLLPALPVEAGEDKHYITSVKSIVLPHLSVRTSVPITCTSSSDDEKKHVVTMMPDRRVYVLDDQHFRVWDIYANSEVRAVRTIDMEPAATIVVANGLLFCGRVDGTVSMMTLDGDVLLTESPSWLTHSPMQWIGSFGGTLSASALELTSDQWDHINNASVTANCSYYFEEVHTLVMGFAGGVVRTWHYMKPSDSSLSSQTTTVASTDCEWRRGHTLHHDDGDVFCFTRAGPYLFSGSMRANGDDSDVGSIYQFEIWGTTTKDPLMTTAPLLSPTSSSSSSTSATSSSLPLSTPIACTDMVSYGSQAPTRRRFVQQTVHALRPSIDHTFLIASLEDGGVLVLRADDMQLVWNKLIHDGSVFCLEVTWSRIIAGSFDNNISICEFAPELATETDAEPPVDTWMNQAGHTPVSHKRLRLHVHS